MNIEQILDRYADTLYRLCFVMLENTADAEDAVQETLLKLWQKSPRFSDREHEKAWLIRVAVNQCRDMLRFRSRHIHTDLDTIQLVAPEAEDPAVLEALMQLPDKYRLVMMLYYVEEYPIAKIAAIINRTPSAVKMRLQKGRSLLGELYRKEFL